MRLWTSLGLSHGRRRRIRSVWPLRALVLILGAGLVLGWSSLPGQTQASAEPAAISQAKKDAQALQQRRYELQAQAELLVEKYDYAVMQQAKTKAAVKSAQGALDRAQQDSGLVQRQLEARLAAAYKEGSLGWIDLVLGASSISELTDRLSLIERIGAADSRLLAEVKTYQDQVAGRKVQLEARLQEQASSAAQVQRSSKAVTDKLAQNARALQGKAQQIAQLEKAWQAEQARLAAEARAAAQAAARQAQLLAARRQAAAAQGQVIVQVPSGVNGGSVVRTAMKYLGVPYVWGGASPSGFDCSGLVLYVFAQLGVSLPHYAGSQYGYGTHVSRSELQPGDLVFYGSPIHHVGIYVGNGNMIDAPYTGAVVRIDPLFSDYFGATRIF